MTCVALPEYLLCNCTELGSKFAQYCEVEGYWRAGKINVCTFISMACLTSFPCRLWKNKLCLSFHQLEPFPCFSLHLNVHSSANCPTTILLHSVSSVSLTSLALYAWRAGLCVITGGLLYSIVFLTHTLLCLASFSPLSHSLFLLRLNSLFAQRLPLVTLFIQIFYPTSARAKVATLPCSVFALMKLTSSQLPCNCISNRQIYNFSSPYGAVT